MTLSTTLRLIAVIFCMSTSNALAQTHENDDEEQDSPWSITLVAGLGRGPTYTGSDAYETGLGADIEIGYETDAGHEFFISQSEFSVDWALGEYNQLSTGLELVGGRDNEADPALEGFPNEQDTVALQLHYLQRLGPLIGGLGIEHDIRNRGRGSVVSLGLAHEIELHDTLGMELELALNFADAEHMQAEVGISAETAQVTDYDAYTPDAGYKGAALSLSLAYGINDFLYVFTDVSVDYYGANFSNSPLIKNEGSNTALESFIGLVFQF